MPEYTKEGPFFEAQFHDDSGELGVYRFIITDGEEVAYQWQPNGVLHLQKSRNFANEVREYATTEREAYERLLTETRDIIERGWASAAEAKRQEAQLVSRLDAIAGADLADGARTLVQGLAATIEAVANEPDPARQQALVTELNDQIRARQDDTGPAVPYRDFADITREARLQAIADAARAVYAYWLEEGEGACLEGAIKELGTALNDFDEAEGND